VWFQFSTTAARLGVIDVIDAIGEGEAVVIRDNLGVRVLQLTHQYPPHHIGGVELLTQALSRELVAHGHQVHVLTRAPVPQTTHTDEDGLMVHRIPESTSKTARFLSTFGDSATLRAATKVLAEVNPDLVHVQHLMGFPLGLMAAVQARGIPYIVSLHDYWFVCANAQRITNDTQHICDGPSKNNCGCCAAARAGLNGVAGRLASAPLAQLIRHRNKQLRAVLAGAKRVVANSQFVRKWFGEMGFDVAAWPVIRYGLDMPANFARKPSTSQCRRFSYVGGLSWQKGVHVLIEAFNALPENAQLRIAGDLSAFDSYAKMLRQMTTHPGIQFLGKQTRTQVWQLLAETDGVVVPALWHETSSLIAQEAIAAGCYVISSQVGALGELIVDASVGQLVQAGDVEQWRGALQQVMTQPAPKAASAKARTIVDYTTDLLGVYGPTVEGV
jgi:glycosyltransferase involved in cell wall biosynthesis